MANINLVKKYEINLEKVKSFHNPDNHNSSFEKEKCLEYIKFAEEQLELVKNGRVW